MSQTAKTPAERVAAMRERRGIKRIPLDGDVIDRLSKYQDEKGWSSRSEALRALLEKMGY